MKGFTLIEAVLIMLIVLIVSAVALSPLIKEKSAYNSLSDIEKVISLIKYARFMSVRNSTRYGFSINGNTVRVSPMDNSSDIVREVYCSGKCAFKVNGSSVRSFTIAFNQYGVPFLNGSIVDNITICDGEGRKCQTVVYVVP